MWIKICGLTTPDAVAAALESGVDAVGFVFARSPRQLSPALAARLAAPARGKVQCIAVTRQPAQAEVDAIVAEFAPDVLQTDLPDLAPLRLPAELELLPVMRAGGEAPATLPPSVLFEGPQSGTGVPCDWSGARSLARRTRLVLAGGLSAANVAAAIADVRPFGVDVSSGVESRPGLKDPERIARFVATARAAFREVRSEEYTR